MKERGFTLETLAYKLEQLYQEGESDLERYGGGRYEIWIDTECAEIWRIQFREENDCSVYEDPYVWKLDPYYDNIGEPADALYQHALHLLKEAGWESID